MDVPLGADVSLVADVSLIVEVLLVVEGLEVTFAVPLTTEETEAVWFSVPVALDVGDSLHEDVMLDVDSLDIFVDENVVLSSALELELLLMVTAGLAVTVGSGIADPKSVADTESVDSAVSAELDEVGGTSADVNPISILELLESEAADSETDTTSDP
jgi:hypothetical protein